MSRATRCGTLLLVLLGIWSGSAAAIDDIVPGTSIRLRATPNGGHMTLVLRGVTEIPAPGSSNDPSLAGVTVTLFGIATAEQAVLSAPPGDGRPGWKVGTGSRVVYRYASSAVPPGSSNLQSMVLRTGAGLRLRARTAGLDLSSAVGAVAVRVELGSQRVCTVFDRDAIRRDEAGLFLAADAERPFIGLCDDASLIGASCSDDGISCSGVCPGDSECAGNPVAGCTCVSPHQPCGGSAPACNGECPGGEACGAVSSGFFPSCGCLPAGSTPCGDVFPSCGSGDCPPGETCFADTIFVGSGHEFDICACSVEPPTDACGGTCPPGWTCAGPRPGFPAMCIPPFCSGGNGYPECSGTCTQPDASCTPIGGTCFCVETCAGGDPAPACGGTCATPGRSCVTVADQCLCAGG